MEGKGMGSVCRGYDVGAKGGGRGVDIVKQELGARYGFAVYGALGTDRQDGKLGAMPNRIVTWRRGMLLGG